VSSEGFLVRFFLGMAGSLAAMSLLVGFATAQPPAELRGGDQSRVEPQFGQIATSLAGKRVEARCWSSADWGPALRAARLNTGEHTLGFAGIGGNRVNLAPDVCSALVDLANEHVRPTDESNRLLLASAVVTLTHEAQHSTGIAQEAVAECNAIQLAHRTAMSLGVGRAYAASLIRTYWKHYDEELAPYRSADCRRGGALDLGHADSIWP
jgi:hypothetical protein